MARVVVEIDPERFTRSGAVVLTTALEIVGAADGAELALVVRGVDKITPKLSEALSGIVATVAPPTALPEIVLYGERDAVALPAELRVAAAGSAAAVLALTRWAADVG
ncbi:hypothetical protein [Planosporangium mesophilum]|uniref:hypothetical protein n=1 Tax=Planosporangium mesophilum TaxID=689768 RepID=UPI00143ACE34|nr:hypothetical protein [Planosporangium mesophilum]NJC86500.1 hypothetical protein [Planosporangium mesophilum]